MSSRSVQSCKSTGGRQYRCHLHRAPESLSGALASLLAFPWSPPYSRRVRPEVRFLPVSSSRSLPSSADVITELSATSDPRFTAGSESTQCRFRAVACRHLQHLYLRSEPCSLRHCLGKAQSPALR